MRRKGQVKKEFIKNPGRVAGLGQLAHLGGTRLLVMFVEEQAAVHAGRENGLPPKGTPKNYLMAWLLVMLKDHNLHGYEIMKELKDKFDVVSDPGTVYRALRSLEREGFISSWWDSKDQGPARRVYTVTDQGCAALRLWSVALEQYRSNLDQFFVLYASKHEPRQLKRTLA